jgi:hypothetical protein
MNRLLVCLIVSALLCLVAWTARAELTRTTPAPQQWEYDVVESYTGQAAIKLNERGVQGWELATTVCPKSYDSCIYYLKRPR